MRPHGWQATAVATAPVVVLMTLAIAVASPGNRHAAIRAGDVTDARVIAAAPRGRNWLVLGGDFGSRHFSPLRQIDDGNVARLGLAWALDIDSPMGLATEPIVVDGTIYATRLTRSYLCYRCGLRAVSLAIRPACAPQRHAQLLGGTHQSRRGGLAWQGVLRHGRLPAVCARCGQRQGAVGLPRLRRHAHRRASPAHRPSATGRFTSATTARTPGCAARWSPSTPIPASSRGGSGTCPAIPPRGSRSRRSDGRQDLVGRSLVAGRRRGCLGFDHLRPGHRIRHLWHRGSDTRPSSSAIAPI